MIDLQVFLFNYPNFAPTEFACHCKNPGCEHYGIQPEFMSAIQLLRTKMKIPFKINSGYRCKEYNASLEKASPNSWHCKGLAADISAEGWDASLKYKFLLAALHRFRGVGAYKDFFHVDLRPDSVFWWGSY